MIRRLVSWWHKRRLHPECAMNQILINHGWSAPAVACTACLHRMARILAVRLPRAEVRKP